MIVRNYFLITGKINVDDIELLLFDTKGSLCFIVRHGSECIRAIRMGKHVLIINFSNEFTWLPWR